jgi:hypothetical protein
LWPISVEATFGETPAARPGEPSSTAPGGAAWQTFNEGEQIIATQPVGLSQHGSTIRIEALERSSENERGADVWRGELRLWDGQLLMGYYAAADGNIRSKGTVMPGLLEEASTP